MQKETDLVSIIIPVYNVAPYLKRCMETILHQSYENLEIILIDDGSIDGSSDLCDKYARLDERILVHHQENKGLSVARNVGTLFSHGKYLCFIDSDDYIDERYVELLYTAMSKTESDMAMCAHYRYFDDNGGRKIVNLYNQQVHLTEDYYVVSGKECIQDYVEKKLMSVTAWAKMFSKDLAQINLFPEGRVYEDMATYIRFLREARKVVLIDVPLYHHFTRRKDSITETVSEKTLQDYVWASHKMYEDILSVYPELKKKAEWRVTLASFKVMDSIVRCENKEIIQKISKSFIRENRKELCDNLLKGKYQERTTVILGVMILWMPGLLRLFRKCLQRMKGQPRA